MITVHDCVRPDRPPGGSLVWRCPHCFTRYLWSKRFLNGEAREGWHRMHDDSGTRRMRLDAEHSRATRKALVASAVVLATLALVAVALIVWVVLRLTT